MIDFFFTPHPLISTLHQKCTTKKIQVRSLITDFSCGSMRPTWTEEEKKAKKSTSKSFLQEELTNLFWTTRFVEDRPYFRIRLFGQAWTRADAVMSPHNTNMTMFRIGCIQSLSSLSSKVNHTLIRLPNLANRNAIIQHTFAFERTTKVAKFRICKNSKKKYKK